MPAASLGSSRIEATVRLAGMPAASRVAQPSGAKGGGADGGGADGGGGGDGGADGGGNAGGSGKRQQTSDQPWPSRLYTSALAAPPAHEFGSPAVGAGVAHAGHGTSLQGPHAPPRLGRQHPVAHMPMHVSSIVAVLHATPLARQRGKSSIV